MFVVWRHPGDEGVALDEGLAFIYEYETAPQLFLDEQPPGTTGLARRLDPSAFSILRNAAGTTRRR